LESWRQGKFSSVKLRELVNGLPADRRHDKLDISQLSFKNT